MIYTLFVVLLILFIALVFINVYPLFKRKFDKNKLLSFNKIEEIHNLVLDSGLSMIKSKKVHMSFNDEESLYVFLSKIKSKLFSSKKDSYQFFNFPRAWLLNGLFDIYQKNNDESMLNVIDAELDNLIDNKGELKFKFDKIDQCLFGLFLIKRYAVDDNERCKKALKNIENEVQKFMIPNTELFSYRIGTEVYFVDTIGMVCPFLYQYASEFNNEDLMALANKQIKFYIENGINKQTKLPVHAVDLKNSMLLGSANWGRGIGWFMLGLAYSLKFTNSVNNPDYDLFKKVYSEISSKLNDVKINESFWPQFVGHTNEIGMDSSATIMFNYAKMLVEDKVEASELENFLKKSIDGKGFVLNSSGDTMYINKYSSKKGKSELTQGLLLSLLSKV